MDHQLLLQICISVTYRYNTLNHKTSKYKSKKKKTFEFIFFVVHVYVFHKIYVIFLKLEICAVPSLILFVNDIIFAPVFYFDS